MRPSWPPVTEPIFAIIDLDNQHQREGGAGQIIALQPEATEPQNKSHQGDEPAARQDGQHRGATPDRGDARHVCRRSEPGGMGQGEDTRLLQQHGLSQGQGAINGDKTHDPDDVGPGHQPAATGKRPGQKDPGRAASEPFSAFHRASPPKAPAVGAEDQENHHHRQGKDIL